ncbi:MAG: hypothetical protein OSJ74_04540 [Clostridia bacterium]|nr:hypothetical protein [Clostridia bacterium]
MKSEAGFTKRQKIALIISLWLYFLWIIAICFIMRANFKGNLINCIIVGGVGCVAVLALYILAFADWYKVPKTITKKENIEKIKSLYRTANIWAIYISIVGFFTLSLSVLLLDRDKIEQLRLAWLIVVTVLFALAIAVLIVVSYIKITSSIRIFLLQEDND